MMMEDRLVRDLPAKSQLELDDQIVIEDIDGTKLAPVSSIRQLILAKLIFNNVEEMKMSSMECDTFCITLGYHTPGDGGGAVYKIVYEPTAIEDKANWHYLYTSDVHRAKFISMDGTVRPEQFGAYGDGINNDSKALSSCLNSNYNMVLNGKKTYKINSELLIPDRENVYIDLNGCTIKPNTCSAFTANQSYKTLPNGKTITIKNGKIDMENAIAYDAIVIDRYIKNLIIKDLEIFNGDGMHCNLGGMEKITIEDCIFKHNNASKPSIKITCGSTNCPREQLVNIDKVQFRECSSAITVNDNMAAISALMHLNINNCMLINSKISFPENKFFLINDRASNVNDNKSKRFININNIHAECVQSLFYNNAPDLISIKDIILINCKHLFNCLNTDADTVIEGKILMRASIAWSVRYCVYPQGEGNIHINAELIEWDTSTYYEAASSPNPAYPHDSIKYGLYGYNYTMHDNRNIYNKNYSGTETGLNIEIAGSIPISFLSNALIRIDSPTVNHISRGVNGQIIGLISGSGNEFTVNTASEDITSRASGNLKIGRNEVAYFKFYSEIGKWKEI